MAEVRTSSYNHVVQTPRIGGCTGAFFNLFDWNSKRFASTKRLPAERPDKPLGRSKSFREDRSAGVARGWSPSTTKTLCGDEKERGAVSDDDASAKPPGLVARLMGLESLPEPSVSYKHRRSRSFSGSESASHSEKDSRGEKLALRDLLKQEHQSFENYCSGELLGKNPHSEKRVRKAAAVPPPPPKSGPSFVPYVDHSPAGSSSCRSVYALPYVPKGEKSPFLARLHPSPVLQPSKCHNQMLSPAKTSSPVTTKKRASRFLEAAVKILEEISDNEEHSFPRERREGMRSIAEFAPSSDRAPSSDLLHCRSMSKIWNGSDDADSIGSCSTRSLMSRGSTSFRDRICRDIFETSVSERALSVSPHPRRPPKDVTVKGRSRGILRTQEAAVGDFKTDVKNLQASNSTFTDTVRYLQQTAAQMSLHSDAGAISDGNDLFTSDEESLTDQLVRLASSGAAATRESNTDIDEDVARSSFRKSPRKSLRSMSTFPDDLKERRIIRHEEPVHDGLRPIRLPRIRGVQQENAKPRSASTSSHSQEFRGQMEELKLSVRIKREKAQVRAEPPQCVSHPLPNNASPLKNRSRRKNRQHGLSPKLRESSGHSRGGERRTTPPVPNPLHGKRRKHHVGRNPARKDSSQTVDDVEVVDANTRDEKLYETDDSVSLRAGHEEHGDQGPARDGDLFAECGDSPPPPDQVLVLGMDDLHWDDGMVGTHQQGENSTRGRYCEIRASGESVQSIGGALDEDVCNVDGGSSPSPQKFVGSEECSELADVGHDDASSTPVLINLLNLAKPGLSLDVDTGEISPVSVLDSPFGDEVCTTSESSIAESERQQAGDHAHEQTMNLIEDEREAELEVVSACPQTPIDRVRQAILDISSFRSLDHKGAPESTPSPQSEKTFVREVLSAAQLLSSPGRSPNWYERDLAVDPSLFEKLEGGDHTDSADGDFVCESGGMWRCDRKLLFDCVNEAFSQNVRHFKDPQPWLRKPLLRNRSVRQKLVEEVQEKINGWRELASHAIDSVIDIDMSTRSGKWTDFSEEVAEVGAEIESMVWQEVVLELAESLSH